LKREQVAADRKERQAAHDAAEQVLTDDMYKAHAQRLKTQRKNTRQDQWGMGARLKSRLSSFLRRAGR